MTEEEIKEEYELMRAEHALQFGENHTSNVDMILSVRFLVAQIAELRLRVRELEENFNDGA